MQPSAQIIKFRKQSRQRPAETVAPVIAPAPRQGSDVETMRAYDLELASLIHELGRYIHQYPRI